MTSSEVLDVSEQIVLAAALFSITIATSLFVMPVVYHHIQFPYDSIERFKGRAHRQTVVHYGCHSIPGDCSGLFTDHRILHVYCCSIAFCIGFSLIQDEKINCQKIIIPNPVAENIDNRGTSY